MSQGRFKPDSLVYWVRTSSGIVLGVLFFIFWRGIPGSFTPISVALVIYLATYYIFRLVLKIVPDDVGGEAQLYLKGIGGFFFGWLFTWVLLSSLLPL
jgi:hypothetical protein